MKKYIFVNKIFKKFLAELNYNLFHEDEYKYLFSNICEINYLWNSVIVNITNNCPKKNLDDVINLKEISEEDFIKSGKIVKEKGINSGETWKKISNNAQKTCTKKITNISKICSKIYMKITSDTMSIISLIISIKLMLTSPTKEISMSKISKN